MEEPDPPHKFADRWLRNALHDPENLSDLVAMAVPDAAAQLDFSKVDYQDRVGLRWDFSERESDIVCLIPRRDGSPGLLCYVLLEHQSGPDASLPLRLLEYGTNAWRQAWRSSRSSQSMLPGILTIVLYTGHKPWRFPPQLEDLIDAGPGGTCCPRWPIHYLCLNHYEPEDLAADARPFVNALSIVRAEKLDDLERLVAIQSSASARIARLSRDQRGRFLALMEFLAAWVTVRLPEHARERLLKASYDRISYDDREDFMTMTRKLGLSFEEKLAQAYETARTNRDEGLSEGITQGITQGKSEGLRELLLEQIETKFGTVGEGLFQRISACTDDEELRRAAVLMLTADSPDELEI